jgi:hypothetical protein
MFIWKIVILAEIFNKNIIETKVFCTVVYLSIVLKQRGNLC